MSRADTRLETLISTLRHPVSLSIPVITVQHSTI